MRIFLYGLMFLFLLPFSGLTQRNVLEKIIRQHKADFGDWAKDPEAYELQVIYTQIDRDAQGRPSFTSYRYGVDPNNYFYPASTVKMPTALLALEKLHQLDIVGLDKHTPMRTGKAREPQTAAIVDATAPNLLPSVGHYVRKIFLVSDNDAHNRLYEFLGQRYLNEQLQAKGFTESRIIHRLSVSGFDTLGNRYTNPVTFYRNDEVLYRQGEVYGKWYDDLGLSGQVRGKAYLTKDDKIVNEPFDFRYKNYLSVQDLHDIVKAIIFPQAVAPEQRFNISGDDYEWVWRAMAEFPQESDYPNYSDKEDHYVKFWMYGDRDSSFQIPPHMRILNKVGWAYGFLTDAAYIVDLDAGVEFMLTGTIHVNENEIYNDGMYEYYERGLPFFGELGRAVYDYELARKRTHKPDLEWLRALIPPRKHPIEASGE
ncbi:MAG: hypothetical protein D6772_08130 [Bacteroidetes bacterium]|nr:MAG: hypothetical protein D6772_08130 [Bacteroidota bacterium]